MLKSWTSRCHYWWQQLFPGVYLGKTLEKTVILKIGYEATCSKNIWRASQVTSWLDLCGLRVGTKQKWGRRVQLVGFIWISSLHAIGVCPYTSRDFGHILWRRWTQNQRNKFLPHCATQICAPGPATWASPGVLSEKQCLAPWSWPESDSVFYLE